MPQRGISPAGINIYIRAMNCFCSWLKEEQLLKEAIVLTQLKAHTGAVTVFSEGNLPLLICVVGVEIFIAVVYFSIILVVRIRTRRIRNGPWPASCLIPLG